MALSVIWLRTASLAYPDSYWHVPPLANQMFLLFKATNVVAFYCLPHGDNNTVASTAGQITVKPHPDRHSTRIDNELHLGDSVA